MGMDLGCEAEEEDYAGIVRKRGREKERVFK